jgi:hypothetical protein
MDNRLTSLPTLPVNLQQLDAIDNQLTSLPENILELPSTCKVDISGNPLLPVVQRWLEENTSALRYRGPQILFSMAEDSDPDSD